MYLQNLPDAEPTETRLAPMGILKATTEEEIGELVSLYGNVTSIKIDSDDFDEYE